MFYLTSLESLVSNVTAHIQRAVDLLTVGVEQQEQNCKEPDGRAADVKVSC